MNNSDKYFIDNILDLENEKKAKLEVIEKSIIQDKESTSKVIKIIKQFISQDIK